MSIDPQSSALLLDTVRDLSFARDLARVSHIVRSAARQLTGADGITFVLRSGDLGCYADEDAIEPVWQGRQFPLESCVSGRAMLSGQPIIIPDIYADDRVLHEAYRPALVRSLMVVPVRREDPIAAIGVYWAAPHDPTRRELTLVQALAETASLALANVQLWTELQRALEGEHEARVAAEAAKAAAEESNRVKDAFLATISHELRTPLNVIQGWIWQLKRSGDGRGLLARGLHILEQNTALQVRLVEDLLDVSRAAAGQLRLNQALVDVTGIARLVVDLARPLGEAQGLTITFDADDAAMHVYGDADRLQQVAWNLVTNAIKFTRNGGLVHVEAGRRGNKARLTVRDTGDGIGADFLPFVFEPFRQGDASITRAHGGLGVGLTIAKQIVELHGGTIWAESDGHDAGTVIVVELPVPATRVQPGAWLQRRAGLARPLGSRLDGLTVLIVDDEPEACDAVQRILEQHGATVLVAHSANEALSVLNRSSPDLLLSELSMPGADGCTLMRWVRGLSSRVRNIPAAALTACAGADYQQRAGAAGFQMFLEKPIDADDLASRLAALARGRRAGPEVH